jgi:hypothetical protein
MYAPRLFMDREGEAIWVGIVLKISSRAAMLVIGDLGRAAMLVMGDLGGAAMLVMGDLGGAAMLVIAELGGWRCSRRPWPRY